MICHRDTTFCSSSGTCIARECHRWIDLGVDYDLPISMADYKDGQQCQGYQEHPAMTALFNAVEGNQ